MGKSLKFERSRGVNTPELARFEELGGVERENFTKVGLFVGVDR